MKKTLAFFLTIVMILALMPTLALAATTVNTAGELTAALTTGGDITLGADIDAGDIASGSFFTIGGGKTVSLDLNGYTLQGTRSGTASASLITNYGTLTIQDSTGGGQLIFDSTTDAGWSSFSTVVSNIGTLTINSGSLINNGITAMSYVVDNLSGSGSPVVTVNGGTLRSINYIAIRQFANSTTMGNTVNINGGMIYGERRGIWIQQPSASNGIATLNISGGTLEANLQAVILADLLGTDGVDISITGGTLTNHSDTRATVSIDLDGVATAGGAYVYINGGHFSNSGSAGNIADYTTGGIATPSIIEVFTGVFSTPVPGVFIAASANPDLIIISATDDTEVVAGVDPTYIIVIPSAVNFGTLVKGTGLKSQDFDVTAQNVLIESGASINVSVTSPFTMKDLNGAGSVLLAYTLASVSNPGVADGEVFASFTESRNEDGDIAVDTAGITKAGAYQGTMVFNISYMAP